MGSGIVRGRASWDVSGVLHLQSAIAGVNSGIRAHSVLFALYKEDDDDPVLRNSGL